MIHFDNNLVISKDKLTEIIDGLHLQMVWVWLAIDSLNVIKPLTREKSNELKISCI